MDAVLAAVCGVLRGALMEPAWAAEPEADWDAVYQEMESQGVAALAAPVLQKLNLARERDRQWQGAVMQQSARFFQIAGAQDALVRLLTDAGIGFVILKGTASAAYYPMPWLRRMGDVDFLVARQDYDRAFRLLQENGFTLNHEEGDDKRHDSLGKYGVLFEMHSRFSFTRTEKDAALDDLLMAAIPRAQIRTIDTHSFPVLPEAENGIVLIQHIHQHLRSGLGLRQIIDWLMYAKQSLTDEAWPAFRPLAQRTGLETLAKAVTRLGQLYLGFPEEGYSWCRDVEPDLCEDLLNFLFQSGEFGHKDLKNSQMTHAMARMESSFFRTLQSSGERNWTLLKKWPFLRPFAWLYQLFRYIHLGLKGSGGLTTILKTRTRGRNLQQMMSRLGFPEE